MRWETPGLLKLKENTLQGSDTQTAEGLLDSSDPRRQELRSPTADSCFTQIAPDMGDVQFGQARPSWPGLSDVLKEPPDSNYKPQGRCVMRPCPGPMWITKRETKAIVWVFIDKTQLLQSKCYDFEWNLDEGHHFTLIRGIYILNLMVFFLLKLLSRHRIAFLLSAGLIYKQGRVTLCTINSTLY